eukprot:GHVR01131231.1.p1 GENE.GHVR01131231.1~~GHVR01131231.1.p1  ORF type:complete len:135 (-),score=28.20 GHVR01131231.1:166-570(-)
MKNLFTLLVFSLFSMAVSAQSQDTDKSDLKEEMEEAKKQLKEQMPEIKANLEKMKEELADIDWDEMQNEIRMAMPTGAEMEQFMEIMTNQVDKMKDVDLAPIKEMMEEMMRSFENYSTEPAPKEKEKRSSGKKI